MNVSSNAGSQSRAPVGGTVAIAWLVILVVLFGVAPALADEAPGQPAGFRKFAISYKAANEDRRRDVLLWYPSAKPAERHNYFGQVGFVAANAAVADGSHPLILFSHGFLGAGDQTIFLMEAFARQGYIVASLNHADSLLQKRTKPIEPPKFAEFKTWTDQKFRDRRDDMAALLDYLLELNGKQGTYLHEHLDTDKVGACGHSLGGYTVLGLAGAWDSWRDERIKAVLALSPYSMPWLTQGSLAEIKVPVMIQGGTLDFGITPFQSPIYNKLPGPKYLLVLKNETHFGWTNLIALGKTTTEAVQDGNAQLITDYSVAFFERHLRGKSGKEVELLQQKNLRLDSYRHDEK
jgi:predicted dienelactone hydrolase